VAFVETKRGLGADEEPYLRCFVGSVTIPDDAIAKVSAKDTSPLAPL
jgi:hypothetical protein